MPNNRKKKNWEEEKERLLSLTMEERRQEYKDCTPLEKVPTLLDEYTGGSPEDDSQNVNVNSLCGKVSLYKGDITHLEVDAIVNAANSSLLGGGGVDGCIHRASGSNLIAECRTLGGCPTGEAKITCGYQLPAKYVIHTVGPIARGQLNNECRDHLKKCYESSLALAKENNIRSIAFPCISTGIYGFPNDPAADIALNTVKNWLRENRDKVDRVIFCVFLEVDHKLYQKKLPEVFPKDDDTPPNDDEDNIKEPYPAPDDMKEPCPPPDDDLKEPCPPPGGIKTSEQESDDDMKEPCPPPGGLKTPEQESDENLSDKKKSETIGEDNDGKTESSQPADSDGLKGLGSEPELKPESSLVPADVATNENQVSQETQDESQKQDENTTDQDVDMQSQIMDSQEQSQLTGAATSDSDTQVMEETDEENNPSQSNDEEMLSQQEDCNSQDMERRKIVTKKNEEEEED
ncbi:ADP-ribose glycohydrolase MACROD2 isoform X2 [Hyperolius riggenbachi]|uniref:ADP-ribose glycohydrolase MACROD2 isoform X2 n=1 Tax=Hyperolius riggenbachi TaxID=752182 RepID=UPI0035A2A1B9